ncbi:hypothetical protein AX774_g3459 [Zancudomyces culisetae]|uniref:Uncharacterized protein n=1 Tax=Zancudomyces culisetae TaxID=1213189 RepID=A0A1R1PD84_ZANCU|nr:hypothetical protein AX774_g7670 [Zancudomyces culisetae]OMH83037.1 hypothetical protein AX774_g3459 [Zancudomyces culisetae]|eukprot:OMH78916.1 hypothetical protein AX774_g7670 [Zancudomyces culisetae]
MYNRNRRRAKVVMFNNVFLFFYLAKSLKKYQSSVLEQVEAEMERNTHNNQGVRTYSPYDNGTRRTTHEAGYDAFLTGKVFVNLKIDLDHTFRKYSGMFFVLNAESPVLDLHTME